MSKSVIAVLLCTLLALVVATVWVPVTTAPLPDEDRTTPWQGTLLWQPIWRVGETPIVYDLGPWGPSTSFPGASSYAHECGVNEQGHGEAWVYARLRPFALAGQLALIVSLGGLLALFFRTRAAREAM